MDSKLNHLMKKLPPGAVATQSWLEELGVYRQLTRRYVQLNWLEKIGHGAFIRSGDRVDWLGAVYAMQSQQALRIHVAGEAALRLMGLAHHLPVGRTYHVDLFGNLGSVLPGWFARHDWEVSVRFHRPSLFEGVDDVGFSELKHERLMVKISSPERAILELIYLANDNAALVHAHDVMAGLSIMRPNIMQALLASCQSVRVKRYASWSASKYGHAWFRQINQRRISFGSGKRQLFRGGHFDSTYKITVPQSGVEMPRV